MIHVVVGLLFNEQEEVLVSQREPHKFQGGRWEFPGGKVENAESALAALQREFVEEVGVSIKEAVPFMQVEYFSDRKIFLDVWQICSFEGVPFGKEGQKVHWIAIKDILKLDIPDANVPIVKRLMALSN